MDKEEREQAYAKPQYPAGSGMTAFLAIAKKYSESFMSSVDEKYLERFCEKAIEFTGTNASIFRRALDHILENQKPFPSISELRFALERLPARQIDYVAKQIPDARTPKCVKCGNGMGLAHLIHPETEHELHAYCDCVRGEYLAKFGTQGVRPLNELLGKGYMLRRKYFEQQRRK